MSKPNYVGVEVIHVPVPATRLADVYALLGAASGAAIAAAGVAVAAKDVPETAQDNRLVGSTSEVAQDTSSTGPVGEVDAAGTVFDPARHTGTKVQSGLWRMKAGQSRPENEGEKSASYVDPRVPASSASTGAAQSTQTVAVDEDDEFAAFTAANNAGAGTKARTWTDNDLSKLTNQAAQKLGSADQVKATIAQFVTPGETPHSRNIPADQREPFAQAIEKLAGIEYAG